MNYQKGFFVGKVTTNVRQTKKHYVQMSDNEKALVKAIAKEYLNNGSLKVSDHLSHKIRKNIINLSQSSIERLRNSKNFDVIEFSILPSENSYKYRILIRTRYCEKVMVGNSYEKCNLCVVIDLTKDEIITAYWNKSNDMHKTINFSKYDKSVNIIRHLLG